MKVFFSTNLSLGILLIISLISCQNRTGDQEAGNTKSVKEESLCFKNEYPFKDNSGQKDIEELRLQISGNKVSGSYNWLPAYKDQRKGTITGSIHDNIVQATYSFMQEGVTDSASLKITLTHNEAQISSDQQELGLAATLDKVECE